ncbi:hypothetical protein T492DRAFT_1087169 [Pavlovales sp. CCMP2436]|nr:hypothetical protein T492DRAFT_1087169 [Pavlovales sp. CCMP2436]|eukprot:CAMPEP_0179873270 /NCGR_PEP_ID=MMETSP0982-20121206/22084_1 /TAXON_ID=483367 /ORGANISM="non described non described, Strain CCMP 2436" /LENGTH=74 /DNA_ID=CAMNT_0021764625 /DNA_START=26 /DNA_END=250 /DNA_ORIENTATION=-
MAPKVFHFACTLSGSSWAAEPLKGVEDNCAEGLEGASAASLTEIATLLAAATKSSSVVCNQITPTKALFTATVA